MKRRVPSGTTLLELLVALPLMALLGGVAVLLLLQTHRAVRASDGIIAANRELRHAVAVLSSDLRPLRGIDLIAWSDTAIEFNAMVGAGIVCEGRGSLRQLDLLPITDHDPARTSWSSTPQLGDAVTAWRSSGISGIPEAVQVRVLRITSARGCAASPLVQHSSLPAALVQRILLADTLPRALLLGSPVRVTRRVRFATYQSSDGLWYVGRTTWSAGSWDVIQPVAGPVLAPRARGIRFDVRDSLGTSVRPGGPRPAQLHIELRALRRASGTGRAGDPVMTDSVRVDLSLRGDRSGDAHAAN